MATDLSQPFPPQTLSQLLDSYTDPTNIANEKDPLKRALMVTLLYGDAQGGALQAQNDETKVTTDQLNRLNTVSSWLNDAASRLQTMQDTDFTWIGPNQWLGQGSATGDLTTANLSDVAIAVYQANGTVPPYVTKTDSSGNAEYTLTKAQIQAVSKNAQLKVDTMSSTAQQDQTFTQALVGKYVATTTLGTSLVEEIRKLRQNINDNLRR
jgi:hypothetical protein